MDRFDVMIDAEDLILGRMASFVAKRLLEGKRVAIVNAQKAVISGIPKTILVKYQKRRMITGKPKPMKGPVTPRTPDRIVWKAVRGMLPMKKTQGRRAIRRLRVYIDLPSELRDRKAYELNLEYSIENLKPKKHKRHVTIGWLANRLGWRG